MKHSTRRRLLSLLLALLMVLALAPTALLEGEEDDEDEENDTPPSEQQDTVFITLRNGITGMSSGDEDNPFVLGVEDGPTLSATISATGADGKPVTTHDNDYIIWKSNDESIARAVYNTGSDGHTFYVEGISPGNTKITGTTSTPSGIPTGGEFVLFVTVSGIVPEKREITLQENQTLDLPDAAKAPGNDYRIHYYGDAAKGAVEISSDRPNIVRAVGNDRDGLTIDAVSAGTAVVTIRAGIRTASITVTVESNDNLTITPETPASLSNPLRFSTLEKDLDALCQEAIQQAGDKTLVSITSLMVPTNQGTIYLGYKSQEDTGAGAGSSQTYYVSGQPRGPYIKDLTFVPNQSYTGEKATISFTGTAANGRIFKGKIEVTLEDVHTDVILTTRADTPLDLSSENFVKVCQEQTGASLSYVIFTLPSSSQGVLYRDYKNALDYGSRVTASEKYDRKGLDDVTFVPAQGFVGTVTIGYAGYSTTGGKYTGELVIKVTRPLDESIQYQDYGGGEVTFNGGDFDDYSEAMTGEAMRTAGRVSFTPPPASQGTLYRSWRNGRGTPVAAGDTFSLTQLDSVTFVAAGGFDGVVRIPFTGTDRNGAEFSGTVEIHIQSSGSGDIRYVCAPGQSVKLALSDFASFCQSMTGQRLHYITFPSLPDFNQGTLYHNRTSGGGMGTRVTSSTKYFNSATPYIANLSFWAAEDFRGTLEIPFTGCAVSGEAFSGLLVISSGAGDGSGSSAAVRYSVVGQGSVRFAGSDFDAACRQATNNALSYLRFDLPSSGQGILYYDQRAGSAPTALAPSATLYRSGEVSVDRVSFVPARGFSGVATVPYTGWAVDGREFRGIVEITVHAAAALGGLVRYETGGAPVRINAYDIQVASGGQPVSLRLTGLPDAGQGRLYYQYVSPTRYSWQGNTSTIYSMSGDPSVSNLTFIPKAGYFGTVEIPYAATNLDGSGYTGVIRITVTAPEISASFDDLAGYPAQTKAAVDYLASQGVVNGTAPRTYEPGASIRRGDFCLMLSRAFQFNVGSAARGFTDVPADAYYAQAVNEMYALGVVNGVGGGRFQPSATISRQDAALMVQRALKQAGINVPDGNAAALAAYGDRGEIADYARGAVSGLIQLGLLPAGSDRISPKADLTRSDMALLLHRAMTQ